LRLGATVGPASGVPAGSGPAVLSVEEGEDSLTVTPRS